MGAVAQAIEAKLREALSPNRLEVVDVSDRHAGHAGARAGGESHFTVTIESVSFKGISRIARQRLVHGALAEELAGTVHALSVKALAPGEK